MMNISTLLSCIW